MGACVGRCLSRNDNSFSPSVNKGIEFSILVEDNVDEEKHKRNFLSWFSKKSKKKRPVLEFVEEILKPHVTYDRLNESRPVNEMGSFDKRDIPLQCLDARALLLHTTTSTPGSSLDLEWEHEALPISMINDASGSSWAALEPLSKTFDTESSLHNAPNTESDWSRVSSANSLEWDNVPNSFQANSPISEVDTDTQQLLSEIERLTIQTLSETGRELFS